MKRRTVLKLVALGAMVPAEWGSVGENRALAWTPGDYQLRFFSREEERLLDKLTEMIIPADNHSPGAHAATRNLFEGLDWKLAGARPAAGGRPTERLTVRNGTFSVDDRWSGGLEASGLVVVLTGAPACPSAQGSIRIAMSFVR